MHAIPTVSISLVCLSAVVNAQSNPSHELAEEIESSSWYAQVSEDLQHGEYAFHSIADEPGVWSAPNRSQELRSRVSHAGLEVFPRATNADGICAPWKLSLSTKSFGRVGDLRELNVPSVAASGNRVELDHGALREWFDNGDEGIEQGWTIGARPLGVEPVWIGIEIDGDLELRIDDCARSGVLVDAKGVVQLRYRDLVVFDATGRELEARLESSPGGVGIRIDDERAAYPLTVDPVLTGPAWTAESDQNYSTFGYSVATAGDVNGDGHSDVIVGAPNFDNGELNEGRVYVYLGSATGLSTNAAWIKESNEVSAFFGFSVSTAGDVNGDGYSDVVIGAHNSEDHWSGEGLVYVYLGSASGLSSNVAWGVYGNQVNAHFGVSVATAGDVNGDGYSDVIVGADRFSNGQSEEGRAYVYLGSVTGPSMSPAWITESNAAGAHFGCAVSAASDVNGDGYGDVIVGAYGLSNGQSGEGRAYVYLGSVTGLSTSPVWTAESNQTSGFYGQSVSTAGDVNGDGYGDVIVGATEFNNGETDEGRAYAYLGSASGLSANPVWTAESDQVAAQLGISVSTAGDVNGDGYSDVIVGAWFFDNGQSNEGRAYVYLGTAAGLSTSPAWTAESDQTRAEFGFSVSTAGDVNGDGYSDVIVGATGFDNGQTNEGRAYTYLGSATGLSLSSAWTVESDQAGGALGFSVSTAGDVNGDGYSDVIVGAWLFDNGETNEGRAFAYLGSATGLPTSPAWMAEGDQANAYFGRSVSTAGDVNGDGYSDVIIGAYQFDNGETEEGRAYVYLGSATGLSASTAWTAESDQSDAGFGLSVSTAGDVNGDGYSDVVVGAWWFDNSQTNEGRAYTYLGSASGLSTIAAWMAESDQANANFGRCVSTAGDVNGDGYSDVIVGAFDFDNDQMDEGRVYLYLGSATGLSASPAWTAESDQSGSSFGISVSTAGDVNGDGYSDAIVGAQLFENGETNEGRAYVYLGSAAGLSTSPAWTAESDQLDGWFGVSVSTAGDVNGDGYSDVIVGATEIHSLTNGGRAYAYLGSATGLSTNPEWTVEGGQVGDSFGISVSVAGDVNGDGYGDVIVGAMEFDNGQGAEGRAFVYLGNEGRGSWVLALQQRRANDAAPVALLGRSDVDGGFRAKLSLARGLAAFRWATGRSPKARLQWQVAPLGVPLEASPIESGAEQAITVLPLAFDLLIRFNPSGIPVGPYHWRARVRTNNPVFPVTPWVSLPGNNVTETKLRTRPPLQPIFPQ